MSKRKDECCIEHCEEPAKYIASGLCTACYAALYYWRGATPTELVTRSRRLAVFEGRMEAMLGSVKVMRKGRRKVG